MLDKLKSIKDKVKHSLDNPKISEILNKRRDMCRNVRNFVTASLGLAADKLVKVGISANFISIVGFVIGIFAVNFLSLERYGYALICILLNRLFDALDGAIAKKTAVTNFGIFLDATLDYIFYAGVIFGFALANPAQNAIAASFFLFAFAAAACAMLAYAVIAYKNNPSTIVEIGQSPFYLGGLAQGSETLLALIVLCIIPGWFLQIALVLGILCLVKAFSIMATAYYNFVIAERKKNQ